MSQNEGRRFLLKIKPILKWGREVVFVQTRKQVEKVSLLKGVLFQFGITVYITITITITTVGLQQV